VSLRGRALVALIGVLLALAPCDLVTDAPVGGPQATISAAPESGDEADDSSGPCSDLCSCLRCPGHGLAAIPAFAMEAPPPRVLVEERHGYELSWNPQGLPPGVFHPPRGV